MQKWEYKTVVAPSWTVEQLLGEVDSDDKTHNLLHLDLRSETDIGVELYNLGIDGWELSAAASFETLGDQPTPNLLLVFKRPKD